MGQKGKKGGGRNFRRDAIEAVDLFQTCTNFYADYKNYFFLTENLQKKQVTKNFF